MTSTVDNSHSSSFLSPSIPLSELCQAILFEIAGYCLALPLSAIVKITLIPPTLRDEMQTGEFFYLGNQPTTLLDLHSSLTRPKTGKSKKLLIPIVKNRKFLVITRTEDGLYAIPVDKPPSMMVVNLAEARSLPQSYPKTVRSIANHVLTLTTEVASTNIFLLNIRQAIKQFK